MLNFRKIASGYFDFFPSQTFLKISPSTLASSLASTCAYKSVTEVWEGLDHLAPFICPLPSPTYLHLVALKHSLPITYPWPMTCTPLLQQHRVQPTCFPYCWLLLGTQREGLWDIYLIHAKLNRNLHPSCRLEPKKGWKIAVQSVLPAMGERPMLTQLLTVSPWALGNHLDTVTSDLASTFNATLSSTNSHSRTVQPSCQKHLIMC